MKLVFTRGCKPRLTIAFVDPVTKLSIDPDHLSLLIKDPARTETQYTYLTGATIVRESAGNYHADIDMSSLDGDWQCRWEATGAGQAAAEVTIHIQSVYDGES
jgi:hypothetical protein